MTTYRHRPALIAGRICGLFAGCDNALNQIERALVESCENCGATIGKLETPKVWQHHILCATCYVRLATPGTYQSRPLASGPTPVPWSRTRLWIVAGVGIGVSVVILATTMLRGRNSIVPPPSPSFAPLSSLPPPSPSPPPSSSAAPSSPLPPPSPSPPPALELLTDFARRFVDFTQANEQDYQNQLIAIDQRTDDQLGNGVRDSAIVLCHLLSADWRKTDSLTTPVEGEVVFTEEVGTVTGHGAYGDDVIDRYTVDFSYENRISYKWKILSIRKVCEQDKSDPTREDKETVLDSSWGITPLIKAEAAQFPPGK